MKIAVIHNLPIDYYPPAVNFVRVAEQSDNVTVITTKAQIGNTITDGLKSGIIYAGQERRVGSSLKGLLRQISFIRKALGTLILIKPDVVVYYESVSAPAVYLYRRFFNHKVVVAAHYHEYMTLNEYRRPGMRFAEMSRKLEESYLLKKAQWISHTNHYRADLFRKDYPWLTATQVKILPNYPPQSWLNQVKLREKETSNPVKCIYVGSLSLKDLYVEEFCKWIADQNGKYTVDFYSFNFHCDAVDFINRLNCPWIKLVEKGVNYHNIPELLSEYNVGLILYKPYSPNVIYCEPNKLFEYLVCGLDVWFPNELSLICEFNKSRFNGSLSEMDFSNMEAFAPKHADSGIGKEYVCEPVYTDFINKLKRYADK